MASLRRWKVIKAVEVRQAPNPESPLFFSASAGKVLQQAGKIVEFSGHGPRLPILPRGWVDVASLKALDGNPTADTSPGGSSTPSTAATSNSPVSGSAVSTPDASAASTSEAQEDSWAGDKSWESWSHDDSWSADRGTAERSNGHARKAAPAEDSRWTRESHGSGWEGSAKTSQWDSWEPAERKWDRWTGDAWVGDATERGINIWARESKAACGSDRNRAAHEKPSCNGEGSAWEGSAAGDAQKQDGAGAWDESWAPQAEAEQWEDELSVADHSACSPVPPASVIVPPPGIRLSSDGSAGSLAGLEGGACNRSRTPDFGSPRNGAGAYRCLDNEGLNVRTGLELSTPWVMSLPFGTIFQVSMRRKNAEGMVRLRTECGWTNEFGAPGGSMDGKPVAERVLPSGAAEPTSIGSSSSTTALEEALPAATIRVSGGFDPASDPELSFVGRLREGDVEIIDCAEASRLFGVGGLQLDQAPPPWTQELALPFCFTVSLEAGVPRVLARELRPVESGRRYAGTLKTVRRHPASEGREATGIGWISCLAGMHLYQKDIYIFLGKSSGKGGRSTQDLSVLKTGDVVGFEIHVNAKGEPQASMGSVALLKSHVAGRSGAIDATSMEVGRTVAVSYG